MSKIKELLNSHVVTLFHDYRLGHANDLSRNANHGVLAGTKKFTNGGIIDPGITGYVSVPKQLFFNATTFVFVLAWNPKISINASVSEYLLYELISKNVLYLNGNYIYIQIEKGPSYPEAHATFIEKTITKSCAVSYSDGTVPKFYKNGVYSAMNTAWSHDTSIVTGVQLFGFGNFIINPLIKSVFVTNTQLSDSDVAKVTSELIRQEY